MPHIIVVVGLPGAGKTFFGKKFSDTFKSPFIDYNQYRRLAGNKLGEAFAKNALTELMKTKQTIVLEGRGVTYEDRKKLTMAVHKHGYAILFVWVQTEPSTAEYRSVKSKTATLLADDFIKQMGQFEVMKKDEPYLVISGKHTYSTQAKAVLKKLTEPRNYSPPKLASRSVSYRGQLLR